MKLFQLTLVGLFSLSLAACGGSDSDSETPDSQNSETGDQNSDPVAQTPGSFTVPDTNQSNCYDANGSQVTCSGTGQDAAYTSNTPSYTDNGDGTVTDDVTGMMWQKTPDSSGNNVIDADDKMTQSAAVTYCADLSLAGYDDWALPDIKAMYSLIDFSGEDVSGYDGTSTTGLKPFVDDSVFEFGYGDTGSGERLIDAQWATTSIYVSTVMNNDEAMFGVNLADGRIKGYPTNNKTYYVQCVRNVNKYGINDLEDNGDGSVSDQASGLMWQQADNGSSVGWSDALSACESATTAGFSDWRLPNAKELQSIVDYSRSPDTSASAAIDAVFSSSAITNEEGVEDYGFYWSSTTHKNTTGKNAAAVYVSFGRALGYMNNNWLDVHGAGAQRSDPKDISNISTGQGGYQSVDDAISHGPQGDVVRGLNMVRCVRTE